MTALDLAQLNATCIHAVRIMLECVIGAAFLTFCYLVAPYLRGR